MPKFKVGDRVVCIGTYIDFKQDSPQIGDTGTVVDLNGNPRVPYINWDIKRHSCYSHRFGDGYFDNIWAIYEGDLDYTSEYYSGKTPLERKIDFLYNKQSFKFTTT